MAGGTDLLGKIKKEILPVPTSVVVDIKGLEEAKGVELKDGVLSIGALTTLAGLCENETVGKTFPGLAEAAHSVATPIIRNAGTIAATSARMCAAGSTAIPTRRPARLNCARKCGDECYAIHGENRYHSIFGGYRIAANQCTLACPAGTDISEYMEMIRKDDWDGAAEVIMRANPMPMITARVCPHPCQDDCNQAKHGNCVNIHAVERALGDYILAHARTASTRPLRRRAAKRSPSSARAPRAWPRPTLLRKQGHSRHRHRQDGKGRRRADVRHPSLPACPSRLWKPSPRRWQTWASSSK